MASIGISEFTFGYSFLYEQTLANWDNLRAAPILPSLRSEQDAGWDAHLPVNAIDFYYQFKLTEYLSRRNAAFIADGTYSAPYYRISLHRKDNNRQHQRLRNHSAVNPHTFYIAPEFTSAEDFNNAFLGKQMTQQSRAIPVSDCDDIHDGDQHYITFQPGQMQWIQHSQAKRREKSFFGAELRKLYADSHGDWRHIDLKFARDLFDKTTEVVYALGNMEELETVRSAIPLFDFKPNEAQRNDLLIRTSQLLSVFFGVALVLVGSNE